MYYYYTCGTHNRHDDENGNNDDYDIIMRIIKRETSRIHVYTNNNIILYILTLVPVSVFFEGVEYFLGIRMH